MNKREECKDIGEFLYWSFIDAAKGYQLRGAARPIINDKGFEELEKSLQEEAAADTEYLHIAEKRLIDSRASGNKTHTLEEVARSLGLDWEK